MVRRRRLFTLEEAIEMLPAVRQIMQQIQGYRDDLEKAGTVLEALMVMATGETSLDADIQRTRRAAEVAARELQQRLNELDVLGPEIKGIEQGLVDFPCERDGRVVYLCWQFGEATISWWHELDAGFAGRQPLENP